MASQVAPNLESLGDAYQFLGELRGRRTTRSYLAKRRADGTDALVTIVSRPEGDERNALSHLAADTKLLVDHKHRNLIRILDGQWVGDDFAVISARVAAPTLRELLDRGEVLSTPRVAVILREVNGVLAWAREQKVVHRTVTPDTLYLDPRTDRVLVSFTIRPIRVLGRGDTVEEDARTIGRLAWAMLARTSVPPEESEQTLADLRPDLPLRVIEATQTLATHEGDGSPLPKVLDYVAAVAMAETLMLGELETAHVQAVMMDEQREQRLAWETEQRACENEIRDQAKRLAEEKAELEKAIAAERASLEARRVELERTTAKRIEELERTTAKRIEETERNAAKRIDEAEKGAAKRVDETERSFAKQKEELERSFAKRREELERTHAKQKEELERAHARQTQELEKSFTKRNEELERAHAKRSEELESEIARQRQELERATVRQREELAAERQSTERALAKQREEFQRATAKEREEFQRTTTRERQELERAIAKERQELAAARAAMERAFEQERARLQQESARLVAERGRLEQDRADVDAYWARTEARLHDAHPAEGGAEHAPRTSLGATDVGAAALLADAAREREVTRPVDREPPPADDTLDAAGPDTSPAADAEDVDGMPLPPAMLAFAAGRRGGPTAHDEHEHEAAREPERESASDRQLSRSARRKQKRQKWAAAQGKPGPSAADASAAAAVVPPPADRPITTRDTSTDASEPPRADEEEPTPTWRDRARRVFGSRWTIPGAGLFLVAAVGTALAVGGDDEPTEAAARDAARPAASVVDSAAGAVVADAPAAGMTPVPSIVPMPRDYSADLPPTAGLPVPAAGTPRAAVPSRRETSERPSARETPTGWRSSGRTATSTARRAPVERVESPAPPPVATSGGATTGVPDTLIAPITPPPANFLSRIWSSITRTDSGRRDSLARARPDTTPRPDSLRR